MFYLSLFYDILQKNNLDYNAKNTIISPTVIRPKLCVNCVFPQYFHARKLGDIMVFFAVSDALAFFLNTTLRFNSNRRIISRRNILNIRDADVHGS